MENFNEVWRPVVGYEGLYEVSNLGKVDSLNNYRRKQKRKRLRPSLNQDGYCQVCLCNKGNLKHISIHRLVAMTFIPNPNNFPCINHKDEDKLNNSVYVNEDGSVDLEKSNLEWCSYLYNNTYGSRIKKVKTKLSIPVIQLTKEGDFIARYNSIQEAADMTWFVHRNISVVCSGKRNFVGGYRWRYEDDEKYKKALDVQRKRESTKIEKCEARTKKNSKPVVQLSLDGKIIKEYASVREAVEKTGFFTGCIVDNCKGRQKTSHGYIFKYKEDLR